MVSLTANEARTIEFLIRNFSEDYNMNQLARALKLSPGGIFKILKKLKGQEFVKETKLGNNVFYKIDYHSQDALDACRFALTEKKITHYLKVWMEDIKPLKEEIEIAILFGSVLVKSREARDIDILLVFNKRNLSHIEGLIGKINRLKPKKIHAIYQTKEDLIKNIKNKDKVILEVIKTGIILWGRDRLIEVIKNEQN